MKIICQYEGENSALIYVEHNNGAFPSNDWDDFCIYIVADWLNTIFHNEKKNTASFQLTFMEGDCYLQCEKNGNNLYVQGFDDDQIVFTEYGSLQDLKEQLQQIAHIILQTPLKNPDWTVAISELKWVLQQSNENQKPL